MEMVINLNQFLETLRSELPQICADRDLITYLPDIFRNSSNLSRMRARGQTPPYFSIQPHIYYLRDDVLSWLRERYQNDVGWISVKKRIPSDDRRVLGTDGKKHEIVCCINSECEWVGATSDYGFLMSIKKVTHWAELPELPKD
jgi:Protein of unknown function (DUF551)